MKKPMFDDDELFYMNNEGFMVFTADYLLQRGYCCGNGCKHCPYDYKAVQNEERRNILIALQKRQNEQT